MDSITKIAQSLEVVFFLDYSVVMQVDPFEVDCSEFDVMVIKLSNNLGVWKIENIAGQLKTVQLTGLFTTLGYSENPLDFQGISKALYDLDCNMRKIRQNESMIRLFLESDIHK